MIQSMTGFGIAVCEDENIRIQIEIKTLNSKYADVSLNIPKSYWAQELIWKNLLIEKLIRGRISCMIQYEYKQVKTQQVNISQPLFKSYYSILMHLANELKADTDIFAMTLKIPGVIHSLDQQAVDYTIIPKIERVLVDAIASCNQSRQEEGKILAKKINYYLQNIKQSLVEIESLDRMRTETMRGKLTAKINHLQDGTIDENRLVQEVIYYIERMDFTEENVRLKKHLMYFEEVMQELDSAGKKLSFIAQEMGREINTIGAKANDAGIQKQVVIMKNELEKIKEQLQNIL